MSAHVNRPYDAPRHPRTVVGVVLAFLGAIALTIGVTGSPAAGLTETDNLPLHNSSAPIGTDCPDDVNDYLHFVITPNNGTYSFVNINMELGGSSVTFSGAGIISNGGQTDNVWVAVPDGLTFDDVLAANWDADVAPAGYGYPKFVLSHLCDGTGTTTTTTTPTTTTLPCESNPELEPDDPYCTTTTTTVPETTTTVPETTTTVAETTTTVAETTTTVAETTTTVAETTTTVAETTTTVAETTTTVEISPPTTTIKKTSNTTLPCEWDPELEPDDPNCTTSTVAIAPPTTVGTGSNSPTTVAVQLPKTGPGSTNTMLALGALLVLVGGVMVLSARREHGVV